MKWKIEVLKNRRIWKAFKSEEEWCFPFCHISSRAILSHIMTSSVPNLHNTKILNISGTRWDMTKRKTPFFFTFKGLSNSPIFQYLNFSFHRHFKVAGYSFQYFSRLRAEGGGGGGGGGVQSHLKFSKIYGGSESPSHNFLNFAKSCILSYWLQFDNKKWGSPSSFLSYKALKAKIKGVFSWSYYCYGNLLCHKISSNLFPDDWAVCWYHDLGVNRYRMVIMTHQTLSTGNCNQPP